MGEEFPRQCNQRGGEAHAHPDRNEPAECHLRIILGKGGPPTCLFVFFESLTKLGIDEVNPAAGMACHADSDAFPIFLGVIGGYALHQQSGNGATVEEGLLHLAQLRRLGRASSTPGLSVATR